jgi:hypothetical protein
MGVAEDPRLQPRREIEVGRSSPALTVWQNRRTKRFSHYSVSSKKKINLTQLAG